MERIQKHINKSADKVRREASPYLLSSAYVHLLTSISCAPPQQFDTLQVCSLGPSPPFSLFHRSGGVIFWHLCQSQELRCSLPAPLSTSSCFSGCDMVTCPQLHRLMNLHVDTPCEVTTDQASQHHFRSRSFDHFRLSHSYLLFPGGTLGMTPICWRDCTCYTHSQVWLFCLGLINGCKLINHVIVFLSPNQTKCTRDWKEGYSLQS